ncbi:riboflavin synthase [Coraliomargarita sp. SDUM461004]|uniref:Riboflavin synthase n=1 Tax=Thalassobacterium sedimentorum TaxID=3041258 RepID=A0ABU1AKG5_9BACT|nr:riboflavin synthase [Coraliomargarita sp. SDUM461004]MDQ8195239.1 riboflavin synthase [Coraliomargarita sp. SDUM461004]
MFTGIVEETGKVISFEETESAWRLVLEAHEVTKDLQLGDSVAVNGCCLTAVAFSADRIEFDLLEESKRLTSIGGVGVGGKVNLERALLPSTRMGGHFVSGHVDGTGVIEAIEPRGKDFFFRIKCDAYKLRYIVHKGSITVDGISLTVAEVDETGFAIWLIPHTMEVTNLHTKKVGDLVNLENDVIAKYVEKLFVR